MDNESQDSVNNRKVYLFIALQHIVHPVKVDNGIHSLKESNPSPTHSK